MRLSAVWQLMRVNILYAGQASQLTRYRQKQTANPLKPIDVPLAIMRQYLLMGALYVFLFCFMNGWLTLAGQPGQFTSMVGVFVLMMLGQGFMTFYNVFYESRDLEHYRAYAFTEAEVMAAKLLSALMVILFTILPVMTYFILLAIQGPGPLWLSLPVGLLAVLMIVTTVVCLLMVLAHYVTKTDVFRQHKQIATNILMVLVMGVTFWAIFRINREARSFGELPFLARAFTPFYQLVMAPLEGASWLGLWPWLVALVGLGGWLTWRVVPQFYEAAMTTSSQTGVSQRRSRLTNLAQPRALGWVRGYVWRLVSEGSVLLQALLMSSLLPYVFLIALVGGLSEQPDLMHQLVQARYLAPLMLVAVFIASFNAGFGGLTLLGHSLERENLTYIQALPVDLSAYVRRKFWLLVGIQSVLPLACLIGLCCYVGMPLGVMAVVVVTWFLVSLAWASWTYAKDYTERLTQWSNVSELYSRGNTWVRSLLMMLGYFVFVALVLLTYQLLNNLPPQAGLNLALAFGVVIFGVSGLMGFQGQYRLAVAIKGPDEAPLLSHHWYYWPVAIALMLVAIVISLVPQTLAFIFLQYLYGAVQTQALLWTTVGGIVFTGLNLALYYKVSGERLRFKWRDLGWAVACTLVMRLAIMVIYSFFNGGQDQTGNDQAIGDTLGAATEPSLWLAYFSISFIGPINEELAFRGYFKQLFCHKKDFGWLAGVVSSLLFGYMHGSSSLFEWVLYAGMGFALYLSFRRRDQLVDSIALHIGNNLVASILQLLLYYGVLS